MALLTTSLGNLAFFPAQAQRPFQETLAWLTDIIPSYNGGEDRLCLRQRPRQRFRASYPVQPGAAPEAFNTVYGSLVGAWAVPVWGEAQYAGTLAAGATGAAVGNAAADLRAGGLALLWGACGAWQAVELATVAAGAVTFTAPLPSAIRGAYLLPLRQGRITSPAQKRTSGHGAQWAVTYEVEDNTLFEPAAPEQYLGDDIYWDAGLVADGGTLTENVLTEVQRNDYDLGLFALRTPWTAPRTSRPHRILTETAAEAWALRLWLHRRAGRYRAFWQPTFEHDMRLAQTGNIASTLTVKRDAWDELATRRVHVAIEADGAWFPRAITAAGTDGDNVNLTLSSAVNVDAGAVRRISYLGLKRLDTDSVDLSWIGNGCCEASVRVVELTP